MFFAVVCIDCSLNYQAKFSAQIQKVKASIRCARKHAAKYGLAPYRIAPLGESAGAHYAALSACSSTCGKLVYEGWLYRDVSDEVQTVIAAYCPVHLDMMKEIYEIEKQAWGLETLIEEYGGADSMEGVPKENNEHHKRSWRTRRFSMTLRLALNTVQNRHPSSEYHSKDFPC